MSKPRWRRSKERAKRSAGKLPDFFGVSKSNIKRRIVADAKYVKKLTMGHVKQVRSIRATRSSLRVRSYYVRVGDFFKSL